MGGGQEVASTTVATHVLSPCVTGGFSGRYRVGSLRIE